MVKCQLIPLINTLITPSTLHCHLGWLSINNQSILYLPMQHRGVHALVQMCVCNTINTIGKDQTTTLGTPCPTLYNECLGSLKSLADHNSEDAGDRASIDFSIDSQSVDSQLNFD